MSESWRRYTDGKLFLSRWHHERSLASEEGLTRRAHDEAADALLAQAWRGMLNEMLARSGQKARADSLETVTRFFEPDARPAALNLLLEGAAEPGHWVSRIQALIRQMGEPEPARPAPEAVNAPWRDALLASDAGTPEQNRAFILDAFQAWLTEWRTTWEEF